MQSRKSSILEACLNVILGMVISFTLTQLAHVYEPQIQMYIWSGFVWKLSAESNIVMTLVLTLFSFARGYILRRVFNKL